MKNDIFVALCILTWLKWQCKFLIGFTIVVREFSEIFCEFFVFQAVFSELWQIWMDSSHVSVLLISMYDWKVGQALIRDFHLSIFEIFTGILLLLEYWAVFVCTFSVMIFAQALIFFISELGQAYEIVCSSTGFILDLSHRIWFSEFWA